MIFYNPEQNSLLIYDGISKVSGIYLESIHQTIIRERICHFLDEQSLVEFDGLDSTPEGYIYIGKL